MCSIQFSFQITGQFLKHLLHIIFRFPDILPENLQITGHMPVHEQSQSGSDRDHCQLTGGKIQAVIRRQQIMRSHNRIDRYGILPAEKIADMHHQEDIDSIIHPLQFPYIPEAYKDQQNRQKKRKQPFRRQPDRIPPGILYRQKRNDTRRGRIRKFEKLCDRHRHAASW